ncbi:MAG: M20/M25/M40 family metallo-hydrolase [Hyphomicrobiaceae bacterium]
MTEVIDLLRDLVRINSVNPDLVPEAAGETAIADFCADWLGRRGFEVVRHETTPGRPSIVGIARGSGGGPTLMLNGHTDTVTIAGYDGDALDARIEHERVWGRGSGDMKAGVAAMMIAAHRAATEGLCGDILVACVADEENGSLGSEEVAAHYRPDAVIVTEPTDLELIVTHKGFVWFDITVEGRAAHGSRPEEGIDAIAKAGRFLLALDEHAQRLLEGERYPRLGTGSVHASIIRGGEEMSSYPAACTIRIERRTIPGETPETVRDQLVALIAQCRAADPLFRATLTQGLARDPLVDPGPSEIVRLVEATAEARLGRKPRCVGTAGWTDSALFNARGIPSILFGHTGGGFHASSEWADIASVEALADILTETAVRFCQRRP